MRAFNNYICVKLKYIRDIKNYGEDSLLKLLYKGKTKNIFTSIIENSKEILNKIQPMAVNKKVEQKYTAEIFILPRKDVLNPESIIIETSLRNMGYNNIEKLGVGKYIYIEILAYNEIEAQNKLEKACNELLTNPIIEDYTIRIK